MQYDDSIIQSNVVASVEFPTLDITVYKLYLYVLIFINIDTYMVISTLIVFWKYISTLY